METVLPFRPFRVGVRIMAVTVIFRIMVIVVVVLIVIVTVIIGTRSRTTWSLPF